MFIYVHSTTPAANSSQAIISSNFHHRCLPCGWAPHEPQNNPSGGVHGRERMAQNHVAARQQMWEMLIFKNVRWHVCFPKLPQKQAIGTAPKRGRKTSAWFIQSIHVHTIIRIGSKMARKFELKYLPLGLLMIFGTAWRKLLLGFWQEAACCASGQAEIPRLTGLFEGDRDPSSMLFSGQQHVSITPCERKISKEFWRVISIISNVMGSLHIVSTQAASLAVLFMVLTNIFQWYHIITYYNSKKPFII